MHSQGFETRTRPYDPTGKTSNRSFLWFFKPQEPLYGKKIGTRENRGQTSRFWELWSDCFSRFPTSLLNMNLKKKKKKNNNNNTEKQVLNSTPFRVGVDGGEGRLLERTVFVEEIEGTRDSNGGGRMAATEACVWVSWFVELTELPFFPPKKWWSKRTRSEVTAHYGLRSSQRSSTVD